jgi:hypothetical protein
MSSDSGSYQDQKIHPVPLKASISACSYGISAVASMSLFQPARFNLLSGCIPQLSLERERKAHRRAQ